MPQTVIDRHLTDAEFEEQLKELADLLGLTPFLINWCKGYANGRFELMAAYSGKVRERANLRMEEKNLSAPSVYGVRVLITYGRFRAMRSLLHGWQL